MTHNTLSLRVTTLPEGEGERLPGVALGYGEHAPSAQIALHHQLQPGQVHRVKLQATHFSQQRIHCHPHHISLAQVDGVAHW